MHMETEVMQTRGDSAYTSVACGAGTQGGRVSGWAAARGWGVQAWAWDVSGSASGASHRLSCTQRVSCRVELASWLSASG